MESHEAIICRFCLKMCKEFKSMEGEIKEVLEIVLPKIDLAVVAEPVICTNCIEVLLNCFDFKTMCFYTRDYIVPFVHHKKNTVKLDLLDVYLSKNENSSGIPDGLDICAFCMSPVDNCSSISLDVEERDAALDNMIEQCVPELDLSIIKKAVTCPSCHASLKNYFHFVTSCFIVEEMIKKNCETLNVNSIGQVGLGHLRYLTSELDGNLIDIIKVETQICEEKENYDETETVNGHDTSKLEQSFGNNTKNVTEKVGHKQESYSDNMNDLKFDNEEQFAPKTVLDYEEKCNNVDIQVEEMFCGENGVKEESSIEMEDHTFLHNEEIEIKTDQQDFNRFQELEAATKSHSEHTTSKSNFKDDLSTPYIKQKLENKKSSTVIFMYQCGRCSFQAKYKRSLKRHMLVHKNPSEVTMYKCDSCLFQTKYKSVLKRHSLAHMNPSEVTMYKCDSCSFQAKHKYRLRAHSLWHKNPSEVTMYKCDSCSYQTSYKGCLKTHSLMHMNPSEITMYKCDSCSLQTKYKGDLKRHMLVHKNPSTVPIYKCDSCSYRTKFGKNLKRHSLAHMNPSEVTMYKCDSCSFQTKYKDRLKRHMLVHKNPSEITMYKCDFCSFETRRKYNITIHSLRHKNPSEVTM